MLGMGGHRVSGKEDNDSWNEISLRPTISLSAEPDAQQASAPPNNSHARMLQIIVNPRPPPAVFRKRVDATPHCNEQGIEEFLASASPTKPKLADEQ
jgi:hypothetical protein